MPCLSYFSFCSSMDKEELESLKNDFITFCEEELGVDSKEFFESLVTHIEELIYYSEEEDKVSDAKKNLNKELTKNLADDANKFRGFLSERSESMFNTLVSLLYAFEEQNTLKAEKNYKFRISSRDDVRRLYINNTIILFGNKDEIKKSTGLYNAFRSSLIKEHNIFLTLLGLEIRNLFRTQSGFIEKI